MGLEDSMQYLKEAIRIGESLASSTFVDHPKVMRDFEIALTKVDPGRLQKIEAIMSDICAHFISTDASFINWATLTKVHQIQVNIAFPDIKKSLSGISDVWKYVLRQIKTTFDEATIDEIHSFLYIME